MYVIDVTDRGQLRELLDQLDRIQDYAVRKVGLRSLRVGIDPLDNGVKFSVDHGVWSPPITGRIES